MKRNSGPNLYSGARTSPGTPEYVETPPKPWSSERVRLPTSSSSRRHISAAALMPFNSGRALPSKWDDAERWITSPISGHGLVRTPVAHPARQPKSKSGPLGPPGIVYVSNYSPTTPTVERRNVRSFMEHSPLITGVLVPEGISIHYDSVNVENCGETTVSRNGSVLRLLDLQSQTESSRDDKLGGAKDEESWVSRGVYQRDTATQMSPEGSTYSSSNGRFSFSAITSSIPSSLHLLSTPTTKDEVRDVQVDRGATTSSHSKKRGPRKMKKLLTNVEGLHSPWNASDASKNASKLQREEAKIAAWENLQKAKAEASIRELEMKLEKKRSASMDKILNKLQASQMKAEAMRNSLPENHAPPDRRISRCIYVKTCSLGNFFFCRRD